MRRSIPVQNSIKQSVYNKKVFYAPYINLELVSPET